MLCQVLVMSRDLQVPWSGACGVVAWCGLGPCWGWDCGFHRVVLGRGFSLDIFGGSVVCGILLCFSGTYVCC